MAPADWWFTDDVADILADTFDDASPDAVAYGTANNEVVEVANFAVAYRVANNTLACGAANNAVAYEVINKVVPYAGNSLNVLMHMGPNYFETDSAMNVIQAYHGMQLPSGMSLKVVTQVGKRCISRCECGTNSPRREGP